MRKLRDWIFTIPVLLAFGGTLLMHDIAGRIALLFGQRSFENVMASLQRSIVGAFKIAGTKIEVERSDAIEANTGYLIVSNHQSLYDIALIAGCCSRTIRSTLPRKNSVGAYRPYRST